MGYVEGRINYETFYRRTQNLRKKMEKFFQGGNENMKKKIYLCHPFDSRFLMRKWELVIEAEGKIEIINPFFDVEREDKDVLLDTETTLSSQATRKERYGLTDEQCKNLVERDLDLINTSDGVIVIIDGNISYGTIQEMVYAYAYGKPIFAYIANGHSGHPWLRYHASKIFTDLEELKKYLLELS